MCRAEGWLTFKVNLTGHDCESASRVYTEEKIPPDVGAPPHVLWAQTEPKEESKLSTGTYLSLPAVGAV